MALPSSESVTLEASSWYEEVPFQERGQHLLAPPDIHFTARAGPRTIMVFAPRGGALPLVWITLAEASETGGDAESNFPQGAGAGVGFMSIRVRKGAAEFCVARPGRGRSGGGMMVLSVPGPICAPAFRHAARVSSMWYLRYSASRERLFP